MTLRATAVEAREKYRGLYSPMRLIYVYLLERTLEEPPKQEKP